MSSSWFEHFHLSSDPFSEDSPGWTFFYGGRYGMASLKLEQALERKRGLIVVTGPPGSGKSALVRSALGRQRVFAAATLSAAQAGPASIIDVLLKSREPLDGGFSVTRKRAALITMIEQARSSGRAIVCVIDDAHHARPGQIKDLMAAIDTAPNAASVFQVILVGRPPLNAALQARALGDLRARITARVETTALSANEITDFLTERLESAEAPMPDAILPPVAMAAIAQHARGIVGLAAALARSALERAAESDSDTVSVEIVEEVASLYGAPAETGEAHHRHPAARAFALGAVGALVVLALVVAAAEVQLLPSGGRRIRANVDSVGSLAGFGQILKRGSSSDEASKANEGGEISQPAEPLVVPATPTGGFPGDADAAEAATPATDTKASPPRQFGTPREEFLGERPPPPRPPDAPNQPYEVQIKPPTRPSSNWSETHTEAPTSSGETVITVPGIPGPLVPTRPRTGEVPIPPSRAFAPPPPVREEAVPPISPPATDTAAARNVPPSVELEAGPHVSLQVGAFRDRASAEALKAKLAGQFGDVYVSAVDSGGDPLYRVRVGKFGSPEETAPLRERLQAAGFASFRVNEP